MTDISSEKKRKLKTGRQKLDNAKRVFNKKKNHTKRAKNSTDGAISDSREDRLQLGRRPILRNGGQQAMFEPLI